MIQEIQARKIVIAGKTVDPWFLGKYRISHYRGCQHACAYCDGRAERYYFEGEFGSDVEIKANAIELMQKELPRIKEPGYLFLGSGITDVYQPIEKKLNLTRQILEILAENPLPLHILTKSALVQRDIPILQQIAGKQNVFLSLSITSNNDQTRRIFEPNTSPIDKRWETLELAKKAGLRTGAFLMPVLPLISDSPCEIEEMLQRAKNARVDFVLFSGMTLKPGRQKEYFKKCILENYPEKASEILKIYQDNHYYGHGSSVHYSRIHHAFYHLARKYKIPFRMPQEYFTKVLPKYTEAAILLAHIGEFLGANGTERKSYSIAGYAIQKWADEEKKKISRKKDFSFHQIEDLFKQQILSGEVKKLAGVGDVIHKMLLEFVQTGKIKYYDQLRKPYQV